MRNYDHLKKYHFKPKAKNQVPDQMPGDAENMAEDVKDKDMDKKTPPEVVNAFSRRIYGKKA